MRLYPVTLIAMSYDPIIMVIYALIDFVLFLLQCNKETYNVMCCTTIIILAYLK